MLADTVFILAAVALAGLVLWWEVFCLTDLAQAGQCNGGEDEDSVGEHRTYLLVRRRGFTVSRARG
jgi:hypothetical protein